MSSVKFTRYTAKKILISTILQSTFKQEEDGPNYIQTQDEEKIFKVNVMGLVVHIEQVGSITNVAVDDGSGTVVSRFFEYNKELESLNPGEPVVLIGKVRTYNDEIYIASDIIKRIDPLWLKIRSIELKDTFKEDVKVELEPKKTEPAIVEEELNENEPLFPQEKVINLIQKLDSGDGVLIEEIIDQSPVQETEKLIEKMLENGDIFQNMPGKVKVL